MLRALILFIILALPAQADITGPGRNTRPIPAVSTGSNADVLTITDGGTTFSWSASGAGGSPGGADTQIQYNDSGAFAGNGDLVFDAANRRVGIGESAPAAQLSVNGSAVFNESGGNNDFRIETAGDTEAFFVDASTNNVGIGTTSPGGKLHVELPVRFDSVFGGNLDMTWTGSAIKLGLTSGVDLELGGQDDIILSNANVGINDSSPDAMLDVVSDAAATPGIIVEGASSQSANLQEWRDSGGTVKSLVDENGNIGIDIDDPTTFLQVGTDTGGDLIRVGSTFAGTPNVNHQMGFATVGAGGEYLGHIGTGGNLTSPTGVRSRFFLLTDNNNNLSGITFYTTHATQDIDFWTNGSERMVISNGGDLGVGESSPSSTLDVPGSIEFAVTQVSVGASPYTADGDDFSLQVDASGGNVTINLPTASGRAGRIYHIKKNDSSANTVTIDGNSTETIDGATTRVLNTQYEGVMIIADGANWFVMS